MPPERRPLHAHLHKLHGFRLKLNRAQAHAETLNRDVQTWFEHHPYGVFGEYEPGTPEQYVFRVRYLDPIPPDWAIALGDFLHNARSALDHLAYLVVMEGNGGMDEWTQFPVLHNPWDWPKECQRCVGNASDRHKRIIESLQPYHRPDIFGWKWLDATLDDPLYILNALSNIDKHRVLNATPAAIQSIGWDFDPVQDIASVGGSVANFERPLVDGDELIRVHIESNGPNPELKLDRTERVEIAIQYRAEFPAWYMVRSVPLKETMDAIIERLVEIFEIFVNEFR
jgi:hypothetical protein